MLMRPNRRAPAGEVVVRDGIRGDGGLAVAAMRAPNGS